MNDDPGDRELAQQLASGESEHLEFKLSLRDPRVAAQEIAALANSGGGRLIIGVGDRGPVGVDDAKRVSRVIDRAAELVAPELAVHVREATLEGKTLVVADVTSPSRLPALAPDGAILRRRVGGATVPFDADDVARLVRPTPEPDQLAELQDLIGILNERLYELQRTLEDERDAAATERVAQAAERAEAAKGRTVGARLTDWIVAGLIGALLGAAVTAILH